MTRANFDRYLDTLNRTRSAPSLSGFLALASAALLALAVGGCDEQGAEGDRCNPLSASNDCNSGLVCSGTSPSAAVTIPSIAFCPEAYCCPLDSNGNVTGTNPFCQAGCNGGAAAICAADKDPGACYLADGGSPLVALELDDAGGAAAQPADAGQPIDAADAGTPGDATPSD